jgi:hypothetical protein
MSKAVGLVLILGGLGFGAVGLAQSSEMGVQAEVTMPRKERHGGQAIQVSNVPALRPRAFDVSSSSLAPVVVIVTQSPGRPERISIPKKSRRTDT